MGKVRLAPLVMCTALVAAACSGGGSDDQVTAVRGDACGYYTNVGLFGGPQALRGCGQPPDAPPVAASPTASLQKSGSQTAIQGTNQGAKAQYGPAVIFGGIWPLDVNSAPASGPISVSAQGTPTSESVTSSTDIVLRNPPDPASPGGFGPPPVEGEELHVSCTATKDGITGSTRFVKGTLAIATDADGNPTQSEPIPDNPPVNYTRSGVITNVGDVFTVVFNQQVVNPDGSLTVNAVHMYLMGPVAVGEMVKGQATCGTKPSPLSTKDTVPPSCSTLVVEPVSPEDPTPKSPRTELIGVFDAGGLQSVTNVQSTNAQVQLGVPDGAPYLRFQPGQTGPLQITATINNQAQPMSWSFDATDKAGNTTHCP